MYEKQCTNEKELLRIVRKGITFNISLVFNAV